MQLQIKHPSLAAVMGAALFNAGFESTSASGPPQATQRIFRFDFPPPSRDGDQRAATPRPPPPPAPSPTRTHPPQRPRWAPAPGGGAGRPAGSLGWGGEGRPRCRRGRGAWGSGPLVSISRGRCAVVVGAVGGGAERVLCVLYVPGAGRTLPAGEGGCAAGWIPLPLSQQWTCSAVQIVTRVPLSLYLGPRLVNLPGLPAPQNPGFETHHLNPKKRG
jgi:hypothetical protein